MPTLLQISKRKVYLLSCFSSETSKHFLALWLTCKMDYEVEYTDIQSITWPVVCSVHTHCSSVQRIQKGTGQYFKTRFTHQLLTPLDINLANTKIGLMRMLKKFKILLMKNTVHTRHTKTTLAKNQRRQPSQHFYDQSRLRDMRVSLLSKKSEEEKKNMKKFHDALNSSRNIYFLVRTEAQL